MLSAFMIEAGAIKALITDSYSEVIQHFH